ncbi:MULTISPECIES: hypothetical protein [unclassified Mesorhizobium]|uniref:hypothetical protein n=1 Tax=unclassified Mesorhizobium TaxID=325217 RepID=UPI0016719B8C|nr:MULTISPECIES: hypothetical protein [unclassified Mesorhizobium]
MDKSVPSDEKRFNETLKRMLKTPPKPHDKKESPLKVAAKEATKQAIKHKR